MKTLALVQSRLGRYRGIRRDVDKRNSILDPLYIRDDALPWASVGIAHAQVFSNNEYKVVGKSAAIADRLKKNGGPMKAFPQGSCSCLGSAGQTGRHWKLVDLN
jgi:hypothetical protein